MSHARSGWRSLATDVMVFGAAFGLANVVSYVYVVVAGRTLPPAQFGVFNALLGVIAIAAFLAASLQLAATQAATRDPSRRALAGLVRGTGRIALATVAGLTLAALPFAAPIGAGTFDIVVSGAAIWLIFAGCTPLGFLAGVGGVRAQAGITLLGAIVRLALGWPLLALGLGVAGGILGYAASYAIVFALAWVASRNLAVAASPAVGTATPALRLEIPAVATFVLAFAPFSLDQLLVQAFAPALGGDYAGLATLTKVVFYGVSPILAVAYPHLLQRAAERRGVRRAAAAAAGGVAVVAFGLAGAMAAFPVPLTELFFAQRFQAIAPHIGPMAFGIACFSLSMVGAQVLIACGMRTGYLPSLVAQVVGVALFAVRHDTLSAVVANQIAVYALQLALVGVAVAVALRRARRDGPAADAGGPP